MFRGICLQTLYEILRVGKIWQIMYPIMFGLIQKKPRKLEASLFSDFKIFIIPVQKKVKGWKLKIEC